MQIVPTKDFILDYIERTTSTYSVKYFKDLFYNHIKTNNLNIEQMSLIDIYNIVVNLETKQNSYMFMFGVKLSDSIKNLLTIRIAKTYYYVSAYCSGYGYIFQPKYYNSWNGGQIQIANKQNLWFNSLYYSNFFKNLANDLTNKCKIFTTKKQFKKFLLAKENAKYKSQKKRAIKKIEDAHKEAIALIEEKTNVNNIYIGF